MCNVPVTIGLCVKNCSKTIMETLKCIIEQDYPSELIEVIVVDDGSSDDTLPIIIKTLSKFPFNFKVLFTKGKGLGFARQLIVNSARGKYIIWVDGDIILPKNHITQQVRFMEQNPNVGKARAKWHIIDEKALPAKLESMRLLYLNNPKSKNLHLTGIGGSICRTEALRNIGGFDEKIRGAGEDIDLAIRLANSWKITISDAVFYHHFKETWRELWQQYYWYGYGMHYVNNKHKHFIKLWKYLPPLTFLNGMKKAITAFRSKKEIIALLLPVQYTFKYVAWIVGYLKGHLDGYGHL